MGKKKREELIYVPEYFKKLKQRSQIINAKDLAIISCYTGVRSGYRVIDAGTGSGFSSIYFAMIVGKEGKVYSYEKRKEFLKVAKENAKKLNLTNIEFKLKDAAEGFDEKDVDLINLDMKDAILVIDNCYRSLKSNGYLSVYYPNITQVKEFWEKAKEKFELIGIFEIIERRWEINEKVLRPKHKYLAHTGFISIYKKLESNCNKGPIKE